MDIDKYVVSHDSNGHTEYSYGWGWKLFTPLINRAFFYSTKSKALRRKEVILNHTNSDFGKLEVVLTKLIEVEDESTFGSKVYMLVGDKGAIRDSKSFYMNITNPPKGYAQGFVWHNKNECVAFAEFLKNSVTEWTEERYVASRITTSKCSLLRARDEYENMIAFLSQLKVTCFIVTGSR